MAKICKNRQKITNRAAFKGVMEREVVIRIMFTGRGGAYY